MNRRGVVALVALSSVLMVALPATASAFSPEIRNWKWPNMCLDADPSQNTDGARVYLWECYGGQPQSWTAIDRGGGKFAIRSNLDGRCLDADPTTAFNGGRVRRWTCNGHPVQDWRFQSGTIYNVGTGSCLDADIQAPNAGQNRTPVQMWDCLGWPNAKWTPDPEVFCSAQGGAAGCAPTTPADPPITPGEACSAAGPTSSDLRLLARARGSSHAGTWKAKSKVKVKYGRDVQLQGRLTNSRGGPVANAEVCVTTKPDLLGAVAAQTGSFKTDAEGRFSYALERGASRKIWFVHRSNGAAAAARVSIRVPAPLSLRAPRKFNTRRGKLRFRGRLRGEPQRPGTLVLLQSKRPERWQTFATTKLRRKGRFSYGYKFTRFEGVARFRFRAVMPQQGGSPFARGSSRTERVRVVSH